MTARQLRVRWGALLAALGGCVPAVEMSGETDGGSRADVVVADRMIPADVPVPDVGGMPVADASPTDGGTGTVDVNVPPPDVASPMDIVGSDVGVMDAAPTTDLARDVPVDAAVVDVAPDVPVDVAADVPPTPMDARADTAPPTDATVADAGVPDGPPAMPGAFKVFDQIPQFGMYATANPTNYTPPAGVLMWNFGSFFVVRLTEAQQARVGADVVARITYHAQCDNYDRLASVFFVTRPKGQAPKPADPRVELVRFITPFSNYTRGSLATRVYPDVDVSTYARALADPSQDVWVGIGGGSNPYDGDPCTNANVTPEFRAIGYKFSLELVSTKALPPVPGAAAIATLPGLYYVSATKVPVTAMFNDTGAELMGRVTVIVSGHGSAAGGDEYRNTQDTVSVNGKQVGAFATQVDCAPYASLSPDGNQGIFRNNTTSANPRNWCPGAVVPAHSFAAMLMPGMNTVSLGITPADVPSGSYYATSIAFTSPLAATLRKRKGDHHQTEHDR